GACALAISVPAAAENSFAKDEAVLQLDGLDLSTTAGQQRLAIRMDAAAREVCGDRVASLHLVAANTARECRTAVLEDIRQQIETRVVAVNKPVQLASNR